MFLFCRRWSPVSSLTLISFPFLFLSFPFFFLVIHNFPPFFSCGVIFFVNLSQRAFENGTSTLILEDV